jgi:hypothetical protein
MERLIGSETYRAKHHLGSAGKGKVFLRRDPGHGSRHELRSVDSNGAETACPAGSHKHAQPAPAASHARTRPNVIRAADREILLRT